MTEQELIHTAIRLLTEYGPKIENLTQALNDFKFDEVKHCSDCRKEIDENVLEAAKVADAKLRDALKVANDKIAEVDVNTRWVKGKMMLVWGILAGIFAFGLGILGNVVSSLIPVGR